jgi:site-specific DNA recombinase
VRVATYTRISTDEENQPYSLGAQDDRLSAYIRSQEGWETAHRYSDQMTGSVLARSVRGLAQILEELDAAHDEQLGVNLDKRLEDHESGLRRLSP